MKILAKAVLTTVVIVLSAACPGYEDRNPANAANAADANSSAVSGPSADALNGGANTGVDAEKSESSENSSGSSSGPALTSKVKVFLVRLDNGTGSDDEDSIGCGDKLVPVSRQIEPTEAPLRAAINELLSPVKESERETKLENFWKGSDLRIKSLDLKDGVATIHITGRLLVAGICDEPRITAQIYATAKQFPTVKKADVYVNGTPLEEAIR